MPTGSSSVRLDASVDTSIALSLYKFFGEHEIPGGLVALLDDVAALAKLAAASVDDIAGAAARAGVKAAGVVIDDAAVTPR